MVSESPTHVPMDCKNLLSLDENYDYARQKILEEIELGRISGPYQTRPISNLRCSPIGLIPKRTSGFRLITHMSYPEKFSINDFIDESYTSVKYSHFDQVTEKLLKLGMNTQMGKIDIKSAFRLLPCYPGDFDLLGFKFDNFYYIDKCMPMGCSVSCATFERFLSFLECEIKRRSGNENIDHYLDDFIFLGAPLRDECSKLMLSFLDLASEIGLPIALDKTEGPSTCITYLGLVLDSEKMEIRIPLSKIKEIQAEIDQCLMLKKITLQKLQSITGMLAFCTRALPAGRAFLRRLYEAMSQASKPFHRIRLNNSIKADLFMWKKFLSEYNGTSLLLDQEWVSSDCLNLYTDGAGGKNLGCGVYFEGRWAFLKWPVEWNGTDSFSDITYLELVPVALSCSLWKKEFERKQIQYSIDNEAVVAILNKKSSQSSRVMTLVRYIVLLSLQYHFHIRAVHIPGKENNIADALSRRKMNKFFSLAPQASKDPTSIPQEFWDLLLMK